MCSSMSGGRGDVIFPQLSPCVIPPFTWPQSSLVNISLNRRENLLNRGKNLLNCEKSLELKVDDKVYSLIEGHGHQNAEHYVDRGDHLDCIGDAEFHLVFIPEEEFGQLPDDPEKKWQNVSKYKKNKKKNFKAKVLTIIFTGIDDNTKPTPHGELLLQKFVQSIQGNVNVPTHLMDSFCDVNLLADVLGDSFTTTSYVGSLTTPPFTHDTEFFLVHVPVLVGASVIQCLAKQVDKHKEFNGNKPEEKLSEEESKCLCSEIESVNCSKKANLMEPPSKYVRKAAPSEGFSLRTVRIEREQPEAKM